MNFKKVIGIDAHSIGLKQGGNETYIKELLKAISEIEHSDFKFLIFLSRNILIPSFLLKKTLKFVEFQKIPF